MVASELWPGGHGLVGGGHDGILSRVCTSHEFQSKSVKPDPVGAPLPP